MDEKQKQELQMMIDRAIAAYGSFNHKKLGDTPTDDFQLVNRQYATANGSIASRPVSSIVTTGQFFFFTETDAYSPAWKAPDGKWVDGVGSVILGG